MSKRSGEYRAVPQRDLEGDDAEERDDDNRKSASRRRGKMAASSSSSSSAQSGAASTFGSRPDGSYRSFYAWEDRRGMTITSGSVCLKKDAKNLVGISIGGGAPYCPCLYVVQVLDSLFLGASKHLYNRLCPLVGRSVGWSGNGFVQRSTRRTLLAFLALFYK